jgi:hypothetical protein
MTDPPAPFAAGVHLPWVGVPDDVQRWASGVCGGPPLEVRDLPGGFSPGAAARLVLPDRPDIFIKAVGASLNPDSPHLHRREAIVSAALPASPLWPTLINTYDDGDWVALAFDAVEGHLPHHPWRPAELEAALDGLGRLHELLTPAPQAGIGSARTYLEGLFGGWAALGSTGEPPQDLDGWSRRHLPRLAELESGWPEASEGPTLLHGDIRSDNMLLNDDGAVFVDWPHAAVGAAVLDVILWAPSVALEGGPPPEDLMARHGPSREADRDVVTALVAAFAGFLTQRSLAPPPPGLPTVRAFQAAQGSVARSWLQRLTGWE